MPLADALANAPVVFLAVASPFVRAAARELARSFAPRQPALVISLAKGLEPHAGRRLSEVILDEWPGVPLCVLSGGSHAEEVALDLPFSLVAASAQQDVAQKTAALFAGTPAFVTPTTDVLGVELSAAFKNIVAIAAGIGDGLRLGDNFRGALITQGLAELADLLRVAGASSETVLGPAGLGDLLATALSSHSRNRRFGLAIGRGLSCDDARKSVGMVVEGLHAIDGALQLAQRLGLTLRFAQTLRTITTGSAPPAAIARLLAAPF